MATKKISELASKGAELEATDLLEISEYDGVSAYTSKKVTGAEIKTAVQNVLFYNNFASFPVTGSTGYLYIDKATEFVYVWDGASYSQVNSGSNFANTNLTFDNNRTHDLLGYKATFDNAELKIIADANTSGDVPFEVTQANGTDSILKVKGDKTIAVDTNSFEINTSSGNITIGVIPTSGNADFKIKSSVSTLALESSNNATLGSLFSDSFGNFYIQNSANSGFLILRTTGASGVLDIQSSSILRILNLPTYADDTSAGAGGVIANQIYKTATGELRIKL